MAPKNRLTIKELKERIAAEQKEDAAVEVGDVGALLAAAPAAHSGPPSMPQTPSIASQNWTANHLSVVAFASTLAIYSAISTTYRATDIGDTSFSTGIFFLPALLKHVCYFWQQDQFVRPLSFLDAVALIALLMSHHSRNRFDSLILFPLVFISHLLSAGAEVGFDIRRINNEANAIATIGVNPTSTLEALTAKKTERAFLESKQAMLENTGILKTVFSAFLLISLSSSEQRALGFMMIIASLFVPIFYYFTEASNRSKPKGVHASLTQTDLFIAGANEVLHPFEIHFEKISGFEHQHRWESDAATCAPKISKQVTDLMCLFVGNGNRAFIAKTCNEFHKLPDKNIVVTMMKIKIPASGIRLNGVQLSSGATLDAIRDAIFASGFSALHYEEENSKRKHHITMLVDLKATQNVNQDVCSFLTRNIVESLKKAEVIEAELQQKTSELSRVFHFSLDEKAGVIITDSKNSDATERLEFVFNPRSNSTPRKKTPKPKKVPANPSDFSSSPARAAESSAVEKSQSFTWKNLFNGQTVDPMALSNDIKRFPLIDSADATQPFVCWNEEHLKFNDREFDILRRVFEEAPEKPNIHEKLGSLSGRVRSGGQSYRLYELRGDCDTRILGIDVSGPGEVPFIFLTYVCNHSTINDSKLTAIERALREAPGVTRLLIGGVSESRPMTK